MCCSPTWVAKRELPGNCRTFRTLAATKFVNINPGEAALGRKLREGPGD